MGSGEAAPGPVKRALPVVASKPAPVEQL
jgi:hypothetical protein